MKKVIVILSLLVLVTFISSFSKDKKVKVIRTSPDQTLNHVPTEYEIGDYHFQIPFISKKFLGFREALAFKESQGRYDVVNTLGYLGKYQFGKSTLERFGIYNTDLFLKTPELQEEAFIALCSLNKWILRRDIERSVGKKINGTEITESGILAAAHLAGAGNVKKYLRSNGEDTFNDAYGSSVRHYLKEFAGYDTSSIKENKKPRIS